MREKKGRLGAGEKEKKQFGQMKGEHQVERGNKEWKIKRRRKRRRGGAK